MPPGSTRPAHAEAELDSHPSQVSTALTADSPPTSTQEPEPASAPSTQPHAASPSLADVHTDRNLTPTLLGASLQVLDSKENASSGLAAGQTDTDAQQVSAAAAHGKNFPVEVLSADAQATSVQLPTDSQINQATSSVSPSAVVGSQAVSTSMEAAETATEIAAEEKAPAVELHVSPELSSLADGVAQAPAGPDANPAPAKAHASLDTGLLAGLDVLSPEATARQSSRKDVQMASAAISATQPASVSSAVAADDSPPEAAARARAAKPASTVDQAVSADAEGNAAQPRPAAAAAPQAAAQEVALSADAPRASALSAAELQTHSQSEPLEAPTELSRLPAKDSSGTSLSLSEGAPPTQPASCSRLAVYLPYSNATVANSGSVAQASGHSPAHTAGLPAGTMREAATAQALVPSPDEAGVRGRASLETSVRGQASAPSSVETADPADSVLGVSTEKQAAAPSPNESCDPAAEPIGDPASDTPRAQVSNPPRTGSKPINSNPSMTADKAVGSKVSMSAADQQLPPGKPSEQLLTALATAAPAVVTAVPSVEPQPKRVTRSRQTNNAAAISYAGAQVAAGSTAAPSAAAVPAASLTTMTTSGKGSGVELIGQRIEVWWSGEMKYFPGIVKAFTPSKVILLLNSCLFTPDVNCSLIRTDRA